MNKVDDKILEAFGLGLATDIKTLSTGLINSSYCVVLDPAHSYLLQKINTSIFPHPEDIQNNYTAISTFLSEKNSYRLPKLIKTQNGHLLFQHGEEFWRCFSFIPDSYSPLEANTSEEAYLVAKTFGKFSADLSDIDLNKIKIILPGFHDLNLRFRQLEDALETASEDRKNAAEKLIEKVYAHAHLVKLYREAAADSVNFPEHVLHHDCKIANMLFDKSTEQLICPVDLDTTQKGLFFSDIGDMIRSMVPNMGETSTDLEHLEIRGEFYDAIMEGYLESMKDFLTPAEIENLDMSGNIIIYMQALRFLTDYLSNDIYYRIEYPDQNKDRAANQFKVLELLNEYKAALVK